MKGLFNHIQEATDGQGNFVRVDIDRVISNVEDVIKELQVTLRDLKIFKKDVNVKDTDMFIEDFEKTGNDIGFLIDDLRELRKVLKIGEK